MKNIRPVFFDFTVALLLLLLSEINTKVVITLFLILYIVQLVRLFRRERMIQGKISLISFNTLFFAMFSFCTYFIPVLVLLGFEEETQFLIAIDYNLDYLPLSLFLCTMAVSLYSWGYLKGLSNIAREKGRPIRNFKRIIKVCNVFAFFVVIYFTIGFIEASSSGIRDVSGRVGTLLNCFLILPVTLCGYMNQFYHLSLWKFFFKYKFIFLCIAYTCISMLSIGDRLITICLLLPVAFIVNEYVYKFSRLQLGIAALFGFSFMVLVSSVRGYGTLSEGVSNYEEPEHKVAFFQDVFPANADLLLGTELYNKNGPYKPLKIIPVLLSPIPFIPSAIENTFFDGSYASAMYLTLINRKRSNVGESGIGTHVIADLYVSWGFIGVFLLFDLFGYIVGVCNARKNNVFYLIANVGLIAWSLFIPRESIFDPYRDITWMIVIGVIIINIYKRNESTLVQR